MARFRSKPVEIEAVQITRSKVTGDMQRDAAEWLDAEEEAGRAHAYWNGGDPYFMITTANGPVRAVPGDWIIREPSGVGCYPCNPDVFAARYEPID